MLRVDADLEAIHGLVGCRMDYENAVRLAVGDVDPRQSIGDRRTKPPFTQP
jgi:hypothetical protein